MNNLHPLQQIDFLQPQLACVIEASAGTGKTWTVERLFIKALLEAKLNSGQLINIENILVLTFTNDATHELKQRIQRQIYQVINQIILLTNKHQNMDHTTDVFLDYLKQRQQHASNDILVLTRAYQNFDLSMIYTIHSFCNKIIHDHQLECQINTAFELINNHQDIMEQIIKDFLYTQIINVFKHNTKNVFIYLDKLFPIGQDFELNLVERIVNQLPHDLLSLNNGNYSSTYDVAQTAKLSDIFNNNDDNISIEQSKAGFFSNLVKYVEQNYSTYVIKSNTLSFDELIQIVADKLQQSSALRDKLFKTYPVIFIDEFQDTDNLQWQIFNQIYHLDKSPQRGHVIVVGDPKQAIYKFRGADVDAYIIAREQIKHTLNLENNFRSHSNILNFINQLFNNAHQSANFLGNGITYHKGQPLAESKLMLPKASDIATAIKPYIADIQFYDEQVHLVPITGKTTDDRSKNLLRHMTFEILALLHTNPNLKGNIAILVNTNKQGNEVVAYLRQYGIKAVELKLGNIFASNTASDLLLFLTAIFDITQRNNFYKAITTKLFNVPLMQLAALDDENSLVKNLQQDFFYYQQIWNKDGLIALIYALSKKLFNQVAVDNTVLNHRELANLWQLAELLNKTHIINQTELLYWLSEKIKNAQNNLAPETDIDGASEELIRLDNDDEQIIITTQHKAKGMEYEIVFCPYFRSNAILGSNAYDYQLPFFSHYRDAGTLHSKLITDKEQGINIIHQSNAELHRLNYVTLTRARSRLYIYLEQPTYTASGKKYHQSAKPSKLLELFGFVKDDVMNRQHQLFNFPDFFQQNPKSAIKNYQLFPGVAVYNRPNLSQSILEELKLTPNQQQLVTQMNYIDNSSNITPAFNRQSYSALIHQEELQQYNHYTDNDDTPEAITIIAKVKSHSRYSILHDVKLKGANFGLLFHALCEHYPVTPEIVNQILKKYNINPQVSNWLNTEMSMDEPITNNYAAQLSSMIDDAFNYPLLDGKGLKDFHNKKHELGFNLTIKNKISIAHDISSLMNDYFGKTHPFSVASQSLKNIEKGFLVGFIDLLFEYQGKYWVLDYKTNSLNDYTSIENIYDATNPLIQSMADHHYYLQYLLYLVACKRYLEQRLKLSDASALLGGAIYYYVRGIFLDTTSNKQGVYIDHKCATLISQLDQLFK